VAKILENGKMQNYLKAFNLYNEINRIFVVKGCAMAIENQEKLS
jgi:hypothetical protein